MGRSRRLATLAVMGALLVAGVVLAASRLQTAKVSVASISPPATASAGLRTNCAAAPHRCGFPDGSSTGVPAAKTLAPWPGGTVTATGTILDSRDITGPVTIAAEHVVIKNSRLHSQAPYDVLVRSGSVTIEDSDLSGSTEAVIGFNNWTGRRLNIHDFAGDGVKLGSNVTLEDSFIHDFAPSDGAHADGAQMQSGEVAITLKHNTVLATTGAGVPVNSAVFIAPDQGPNSPGPVTIAQNLFSGGNYTLYVLDGANGRYIERNVTVSGNRFVPRSARYGPEDITVPVVEAGSIWDDTGLPVS